MQCVHLTMELPLPVEARDDEAGRQTGRAVAGVVSFGTKPFAQRVSDYCYTWLTFLSCLIQLSACRQLCLMDLPSCSDSGFSVYSEEMYLVLRARFSVCEEPGWSQI